MAAQAAIPVAEPTGPTPGQGTPGTIIVTSGAEPTLPSSGDPTALPPPAAVDITAAGSAGTESPDTQAGTAPPLPRHKHRRRSRHRLRWALAVVAVVAVVVGSVAAVRINRPLAPPTLHSALPSSVVVPGSSPALPWPVLGQGAVSVPALGYASQSGPEAPVPIASLTKMANAVVILRDHPLAPGASGPMITITPGDVSQYDFDLDNDESNIPIQAGRDAHRASDARGPPEPVGQRHRLQPGRLGRRVPRRRSWPR